MGMNNLWNVWACIQLMAVVSLSLGCSQIVETEIGNKLVGMSLRSKCETSRARNTIVDVCAMLDGQSPEVKINVVRSLSAAFSSLPFDDSSYESRIESFDSYYELACFTTECLGKIIDDGAVVFGFKFESLGRINAEIDKGTKEPKGGAYGNLRSYKGMGTGQSRMIQRHFLDILKRKRYDVVRDGFELDRVFCEYFWSLSVFEQERWRKRLETLAHRRVVVYDRRHPLEMPIPYASEDSREWLPAAPGESRKYVEHIGGGQVSIVHEVIRPKKHEDCLEMIHDAIDARKRNGAHFFAKAIYVWGVVSVWGDQKERLRIHSDFVNAMTNIDLTVLSVDEKKNMLHWFWRPHAYVASSLFNDFGDRQLAESIILEGFSKYKQMCFSFGEGNVLSGGDGMESRENVRLSRLFKMEWERDVEKFSLRTLVSIFPAESGGVSEAFKKKWHELTGR